MQKTGTKKQTFVAGEVNVTLRGPQMLKFVFDEARISYKSQYEYFYTIR